MKSFTKVVFMTENEFLNQTLRDKERFLNCFDTFVVDEAHELRKPQLVILAIIRKLLARDKTKKIIVTSATLEAKLFENYFKGFTTCLIEAKTPTYGVEIIYNLYPDLETNIPENTLEHLKVIVEHIKKNNVKGGKMPNVLVFLSSIPVIKQVLAKQIEDESWKVHQEDVRICFEEFHGALTPSEKNQVLDPTDRDDASSSIRIILTTRIAETAVTIQDVAYVLDSGKEKEKYHDEITSFTYMKEEDISQSSAIQRKGRAGRLCNGYCYRMYRNEDYEKFEAAKKPEIVRSDISGLILLAMELNDYFKLSDLMFYEEIQERAIHVKAVLDKRECFERVGEGAKSREQLSNKGHFIVESSLEPNSAAFLYENLRMKNYQLGMVATIILEKTTGYFRSNDTLREFTDKELGFNHELVVKLGDLAPVRHLLEVYDNLSPEVKKNVYDKKYGIGPKDVERIKKDRRALE